MMIEPHHAPPQPAKPTSYREYRRLKEEAEKRRREQEERMRKEEQARIEAEEKARKDIEEEKTEEESSIEEQPAPEPEIEVKPVKEVKDPRRRKIANTEQPQKSLSTESNLSKEAKPPEKMKSFKIPKMKKAEPEPSVEQRKTTASDKPKLAERSKLIKERARESSDEASQRDTDSDSEPGLTIAEDAESKERRRSSASESDQENKFDRRKSEDKKEEEVSDQAKDESAEESGISKNELTKELLKSIVASLDPQEATKLLAKTASIKDKISIETLKDLIGKTDSKDDEDETAVPDEAELSEEDEPLSVKRKRGRPKTPTKDRAAKKTKVSKGKRRSLRLQEDDPEEVGEAEEAIAEPVEEEEGQMETFVIEPKAVGKRGRKKKGRKAASEEQNEEPAPMDVDESSSGLQDDAISSSNIEEESLPDHTDMKVESVEEVAGLKVEVEDEPEVAEAAPVQPPGMRQTRAMRSRMMKTKTWKPSSDVHNPSKELSKLSCLKSPPLRDVIVKKESTEADMKVFLGEGEVAKEEFKENKFEFSKGSIDVNSKESIKSRHSAVASLLDKLQQKDEVESKDSSQPSTILRVKKSKSEPKETLCSKIKLHRPPIDEYGYELRPAMLKEEIKIKPIPLPAKLSAMVKGVEESKDEQDKVTDKPSSNLLELIHSLKKRQTVPPALIPLGEEPSKQLDIPPEELEMFSRETVVENMNILNYKEADAYQQLLVPHKLQHLLKCMAFSCQFSTNDVSEYTDHVTHEHGGGETSAVLRCCHCLGRVRTLDKLVHHVIRHHGSASHQCLHCFTRSPSLSQLLLHQNIHHPSLSTGFLNCDHLIISNHQSPKISSRVKLKCLANSCSFVCESNNAAEMEKHGWTHFKAEQMLGFSCGHCSFSSFSPAKVLLHLSIQHPHSVATVIMKLTNTSPFDDDEDGDSSLDDTSGLESDVDSEMSDFDKHFYDDDEEDTTETTDTTKADPVIAETGLRDHELYRCGNPQCSVTCPNPAQFKDHLLQCPYVDPLLGFSCVHCQSEHTHLQSLLEHLKTHSPRRYLCSLCDHREPTLSSMKLHARTDHQLLSVKFVALDGSKTNQDRDYFICVPKSNNPRTAMGRGRPAKDTFKIEDIGSIPVKPDIYKYVLHCGLCDYGTRVRNNLVKHLKLHKKKSSSIPVLAPVNPPVDETEPSALSRMTSLLPDDLDEELKRKPLTFEELAKLPCFVPETSRFACSAKDCVYITIDEGMLLYHIKGLHKELRKYKCPHCPDTSLAFTDIGHHLKCHSELLFKCGHCDYFHWQKRTAEAHAAEQHANRKYFVKNVREEEERRKALGPEEDVKKETVPEPDNDKIIAQYTPFKCGLCEHATETIDRIQEHCREQHNMDQQFKCGLCPGQADTKLEMESHVREVHQGHGLHSMVRVFYIDPRTVVDPYPEERHAPLWARDMEGLRHIRGILYEELEDEAAVKHAAKLAKARAKKLEQEQSKAAADEAVSQEVSMAVASDPQKDEKGGKNRLDMFPMSCQECGFHKKTVTGMKMHIKLNHLQVGKFQCSHCVFTANLTNSIQGHYRNKHPDHVSYDDVDGREIFDYVEKVASAQNFDEQFWKLNWNIPTLKERKQIVNQEQKKRKKQDDSLDDSPPLKKKPGAKRGRKRKSDQLSQGPPQDAVFDDFDSNIQKAEQALASSEGSSLPAPSSSHSNINPKEVSPFESVKTFMCGYCPKRSQALERIKRHQVSSHSDKALEYHELTRDQVVAIITSDQYAGSGDNEYKCFYCQVNLQKDIPLN